MGLQAFLREEYQEIPRKSLLRSSHPQAKALQRQIKTEIARQQSFGGTVGEVVRTLGDKAGYEAAGLIQQRRMLRGRACVRGELREKRMRRERHPHDRSSQRCDESPNHHYRG